MEEKKFGQESTEKTRPEGEAAPEIEATLEDSDGKQSLYFTAPPSAEAELSVGKEDGGDGLAIAALVLSILSICCCGLPFSIAALVLSILDRRRRGAWEGLGLVALILSILGLLSGIVSAVYSVIMMVAMMQEEGLGEGGFFSPTGGSLIRHALGALGVM